MKQLLGSKMSGISVFFMLLSVSSVYAKTNYFKSISAPERWWVISHPFVAKKALKISLQAREVAHSIAQHKILKGTGNGGQIDAFRHTFWMATLSKEIGVRRALRLGIAHEKGNKIDYKRRMKEDGVVPDQISSVMDLFNNKVGILLGQRYNHDQLKEVVLDAVTKGDCKIIKTNSKGDFLDINGQVIDKEELMGTWFNKKCLVPSNYQL